jgi:hypothetical protein
VINCEDPDSSDSDQQGLVWLVESVEPLADYELRARRVVDQEEAEEKPREKWTHRRLVKAQRGTFFISL